ncbi:SDR family NAD(P)-dependent oxidoreductase [Olsenella profusa]|uniref:SDR family NAD(P)-dependent oxidoreductase n=1 Tax=Olsenella profusa TaxID=138595 RepID=A0ABS2EZT0_9ACTN|nr:SDR family NAD(P)-dependent oxidoreductase [Olsenella profusa]MBM6774226.1 SDR family NAD(P)-dependent oxidoreductase [Olsenella profusa]
MTDIAIVTGASSGLGREIVRQLDAGAFGRLDQIWAVARSAGTLAELADACATPVRPLALDLTDPASFDVLEDALAERPDTRVVLLVNNAGFGTFGAFADQPAGAAADMVRLLMLAPVELTYRSLPHMRVGSRVLNVASVAAFVPQPELAVYSAAKRFVLDFSRALNEELGPVGIHVTALCPKFMRTGFLDHAGAGDVAADMARLTGFEDVGRVARRGLAAARAGRALCVPSLYMRAFYVLAKLMPYPVFIGLERALMGRFDARVTRRED